LLLKKININLASNNNEAIRLASTAGHDEIVRLLLERPGVNPSARDNEAIRLASLNLF
jgi:ankyrin repeat protein